METRVKGQVLLTTLDALREVSGPGAVQATLDHLGDAWRRRVEHEAILPNAWYAVGELRELYGGIRAATKSDIALARRLGYLGTVRDFRGIYKVFVRMLAPVQLLKAGARIYKNSYDRGQIEVLESGAGRATARFHVPGFDENLWVDTLGSVEGIFEVCGAKSVRARVVEGGRDGDDRSTLEVHWI